MKKIFRDNKNNIIKFVILFVPTFIIWCALWPGYLQNDHQYSIISVISGEPNEWHSLVWTYLSFPFIFLSGSYSAYGIVQNVIFALCITFGISRLEKINFIKHSYVLTFVMALFLND